eukprot:s76_g9.t1
MAFTVGIPEISEAFLRRHLQAAEEKPPPRNRSLEITEARGMMAHGLSSVGVESLRDALESWGAEWNGFISEWDWQHIARQLLELNEESMHDAMAPVDDVDDTCEGEAPAADAPEEEEQEEEQEVAHLPNVLQAHMAAPEIVNKCDAKETWLVHDGMQIKCMDAYFNSKNKCPLCPGYRKQMPEEDGMCEEAEVLAISRFAWGPVGCLGIGDEKPVPADADVHLRVHLLDIFPAPGQCGRAEWTRQLQELEWRKSNGNDHFKRQTLG